VSVTHPIGFSASGVAAGLKASGRADLGLLVAERPAAAAAAFTTNALPAAPVVLGKRHLADGRARAVVVNSGQANAGTGPEGLTDAEATAAAVASAIGAVAEDVVVCSTGVIGPRVPVDRLTAALPDAVASLDTGGGAGFAEAILTTDVRPKEASATAGPFRVGGCVKGAGMIAPRLAHLATMLAFLTTDAPATPALLRRIVAERLVPVWNSVVVDGCQSTNDTVLLLASGVAGGPELDRPEDAPELVDAIEGVARDLARQMVADAEGASTVLVVQVDGAHDAAAARQVGLAVAGSPLVKTAVFGADPNAGRLLQAVGDAGVPVHPERVRVALGGITMIEAGVVLPPEDGLVEAMKEPEVVVEVRLGDDDGSATVFGCDLGYEYVRINAEYRT